MSLRIGQGFDVHAFGDGDHLILAGVKIPYHRGFIAHSDGDVLLHSLCDALLGALSLGDIGHHFPDTCEQYKNINSRLLLQSVWEKISARGYQLANADITIIAQAPKMAEHIVTMRENIAADLHVDIEKISVKATTTERQGFTGREEGIACQSTVLLQSKDAID